MKVRDLALKTTPILASAPASEVFGRLDADLAIQLLAVTDDAGRPLGVIDRQQFGNPAFARHARTALADWPADRLMQDCPLLADADELVTDYIANVMTGENVSLPSGLIVVDQDRYFGLCDIASLFRAAMDERSATASEMFDLIQTLQAAHAEAEASRKFNTAVIEHIPATVWVKHAQTNRFVMLNRAGETLLGVSRDDFIGLTSDEFFPPEMAGDPLAGESQLLKTGGVIEFDAVPYVRRSDWDERFLKLKKIAIPDASGETEFILGVGEEITERHRIEKRFERLAKFDPATNLPNKASFVRDLADQLSAQTTDGGRVSLLVIGLDGVRMINDTLGHSAGEDLLYMMAGRLRESAEGGLIARLGSDEFAVLAGAKLSRRAAESLAKRIVTTLEKPCTVRGQTALVRARVGIAVAPEHATDAVELIKRAEIALHSVKPDGSTRHRVFECGMDDHVQQQRALELDIRAALKEGEFEAHFQPQYDIKHKRISGFETLVRWRHATRGWVSPSDFVPVAEQLGLIGHLGEQMLHQACHAAVTWPSHMTVAVNVSTNQLKKRGFTSVVAQALSGSGLPADRLELEITESVLVDDDEMIINQLHQLRGLGVRLSLDDFGTGYASLGYLNRLPVTKIKIDQSFVKKLPDATDSIAIIGAITQLAQQLGMSTTAEGVETEAQLEAVAGLGCTHVQGYLIGRATANPLTQTYQAA